MGDRKQDSWANTGVVWALAFGGCHAETISGDADDPGAIVWRGDESSVALSAYTREDAHLPTVGDDGKTTRFWNAEGTDYVESVWRIMQGKRAHNLFDCDSEQGKISRDRWLWPLSPWTDWFRNPGPQQSVLGPAPVLLCSLQPAFKRDLKNLI